jgi:hypothetical protein
MSDKVTPFVKRAVDPVSGSQLRLGRWLSVIEMEKAYAARADELRGVLSDVAYEGPDGAQVQLSPNAIDAVVAVMMWWD